MYLSSTNHSFGGGAPLHVRDPYEVKTVKLARSTVFPEGGEGVIAIRDIPRYRFAAMYSLFSYTGEEEQILYQQACTMNTSKSDEYRRNCKKYSLEFNNINALIDLPPDMDAHPLPNLGIVLHFCGFKA